MLYMTTPTLRCRYKDKYYKDNIIYYINIINISF